MALVKIGDFYTNYQEEIFGGKDIKGFEVYSEQEEKIGFIYDALVDATGRFRYFVIDLESWIFGKKVLLPVGLAQIDYENQRLKVLALTKEQAEHLPLYDENMTVDYNYEEMVRSIYRPLAMQAGLATVEANAYTSENYSYQHEPDLYAIAQDKHQILKLYEEQLVTNKERFKTGEVAVGKRVEAETAKVSVPYEKERVVIERNAVSEAREVEPGTSVEFQEGEVARMEVYEESVDIDKKAYVREEVGVRKEIERDVEEAEETVRREELEVNVEGEPVVKRDRV
ncbi:DUF2382 domain-containing protein [Oscillatoria salina]|uniref:DUF2382 domain-containing protein n=1 Tax=Oscillatoria salina TaxID=331517 RepID=UPI0013BB2439|nr:DUF2382 domain-containing protein [Oscillatoria salina]MBZ8182800.1 DUF2382 domain-containing protein [Oscillatoria salina IIICB1]NET87140.1 DUF2382 domain-containing protein [Kamptonema sp. SIO1D9]